MVAKSKPFFTKVRTVSLSESRIISVMRGRDLPRPSLCSHSLHCLRVRSAIVYFAGHLSSSVRDFLREYDEGLEEYKKLKNLARGQASSESSCWKHRIKIRRF